MSRLLVQLLAVIAKEVRQTVKDRRVMFLLTVAPFLQLVVFGYAIEMEIDRVPTAVVDLDDTPTSRETVRALLADRTLAEVDRPLDVERAERMLERSEAVVALVVPQGFERDRLRGDPAQVQVILDGAEPTRASVAGAAAGRYLLGTAMDEARAQVAARGLSLPGVDVRPRLLFNPTLASPVYFVPGIAGMLLLIITTMVTAMGLAREREIGTLEQVRVTPIPSGVLLLGKTLPFVAVGLADVTAALAAGGWIFDVPLRGSLLLFYGATALYLLTTVGLGLLVATVSETQQQAFISAYLVILPAMLLSGTLSPIHAMPDWLQPLTWANPLRFYMQSARAILLKGATAQDLVVPLSALAAYGTIILTVASARFRKRVG
ncbi:MAG TPA: ABC transporter permease [Myxococcota bacterium]|nr:ABC transporter permease [Myxococcota bacterium]